MGAELRWPGSLGLIVVVGVVGLTTHCGGATSIFQGFADASDDDDGGSDSREPSLLEIAGDDTRVDTLRP